MVMNGLSTGFWGRRRLWVVGVVWAIGGAGAPSAMADFDGLGSFGEVRALNPNAAEDTGDDSHLRIATDGAGNWVAVWQSDEGFGADLDILVSTSSDGGVTWSAPAAVNDDAATDGKDDVDPALITDRQGGWLVVWTAAGAGAAGGTATDIRYARSTDNGASWSPQGALATPEQQIDAGAPAGSDSGPGIALAGTTALAVWSSTRDIDGNMTEGDTPEPIFTTDADIFMAISTDGGENWGPATAINTTHETDDADDTRPSIATDGAGYWMAVWHSGGRLWFARSEDNAATFTDPAALPGGDGGDNPTIVSDGNRSYADDEPFEGFVNVDAGYWLATFELGGAVVVCRYLDLGPDFDLDVPEGEIGNIWRAPLTVGDGSGPSLTTDTRGSWLLGWHATGAFGEDADVLASRSLNNGIDWSEPGPLDPGADSDAGDDTTVRLETDRGGNWLAAWVSNGDAGGLGSDRDILIVPFTFLIDCNENGVEDGTDIASGASDDGNGDGVPDDCQAEATPGPTTAAATETAVPGPTATPEPGATASPVATGTPEPGETPEPTETSSQDTATPTPSGSPTGTTTPTATETATETATPTELEEELDAMIADACPLASAAMFAALGLLGLFAVRSAGRGRTDRRS